MRRRVLQVKNAVLHHLAVPGLTLLIGIGSALGQSGDLRAQDQSTKPPAANSAPSADAAKETQRKTVIGTGEGVDPSWLGRRVVVLMWRDDLDTAFRHLDLYDRFGCPGGHVQATFRCLVRFFSAIDPKVPDSLSGRVHACWINPAAQPQAAAATPAPATSGAAAPAPAAAAPPAAAAAPTAK